MVKPRDVLIDCQDLPFALRCLQFRRARLLTAEVTAMSGAGFYGPRPLL